MGTLLSTKPGPLKKYRNEPAFMKALEEIWVKSTKQMQQVNKPLYQKSQKKEKGGKKKERKTVQTKQEVLASVRFII